ncbi:MAG TPA: pyridoxal phosphate-dependent aminotransferase [Planctomycetota bacterium]|nr:pyridoxal phosphate-dependent aminotransferase [Planctomycetota bacterium]
MRLTQRVSGISLSVTLALDARAKALAAGGRDVINMSVGEPDFPAPAAAREAACDTVRSGAVRYTPAGGTPALRRAIAEHLSRTRGVPFGPEQVIVCHSTKHALSGAVLALVEPGDEVILCLPAWVSYDEMIRLAGGTPVSVEPRADCGPDFDRIQAAMTPRTRALLLNSPCNPTGYVWTRAEVERLAKMCSERGVLILSDEIYRGLVYEGEPNPSPVSCGDAARSVTVIVDGASKVFAMTGYRIGFVAGPPAVASAVERLHSHLVGAPNTVSQAAYLAALSTPGGEPPEIADMAAEFDRRRRFLLERLDSMGLATPRPRGAFYAFPDVSRWLDERGSAGFCEDLLEDQALALVPGSAFGVDTHVRLSYALSMERIAEACERLRSRLA